MALLQPKLSLKVAQRQILTPGLMQMVSVLALNKLELKEMITAEMVENPVLEEIDESVPLLDEVGRREAMLERVAPERTIGEGSDESVSAANKDPFDEIDFGSYFQEYLDPGFRTQREHEELDQVSFEHFLSQPTTLADHLLWQLGALSLDSETRAAAEFIIGNLDEDGYLTADVAELVQAASAEMEMPGKSADSTARIEAAIRIVQQMDPVGVGAKDLRQCLRLQIEAQLREFDLLYAPQILHATNGSAAQPGILRSVPASRMESGGSVGVPPASPSAVTSGMTAGATAALGGEIAQTGQIGRIGRSGAVASVRETGFSAYASPVSASVAGAVAEPPAQAASVQGIGHATGQAAQPAAVAAEDPSLAPHHGFHHEAEAVLEQRRQCMVVACQIVDQHLQLLQKRDAKELARALGRPVAEAHAAVEFIRTLDPRPGQRHNREQTRLIEPDVVFVKRGDTWVVAMNDEDMPSLRLSHSYRRMLTAQGTDKEVRDYVKERFRSALQLMRNIAQRKSTILRTCEVIVRRQRDFLEDGIESLRPMMIKEVAEEIGVHPSTISRAVANKYAHTPQGVLELRSFFSEGANGPEGADTPLLVLKRKVRKLIEEEDARNPLTDDQLAAMLHGQGIQVTRRTVAKYREDLNIPSTHQRRRRDA